MLFVGVTAACAVFVASRSEPPPLAGGRYQSERQSAASPSSRRVYPYSVIPGGVYSQAELRSALSRDPVAASHYASFEPALLHTTELSAPRTAYVSYRVGSTVYWTRNPIRMPKGDTLITDGVNYARARCGNRISAEPQKPIAQFEPPRAELENLPIAMLEPPSFPWTPPEDPAWIDMLPAAPPPPISDELTVPPPPAPPPPPRRYTELSRLRDVYPGYTPHDVPEPGSLAPLLITGVFLVLVGYSFRKA